MKEGFWNIVLLAIVAWSVYSTVKLILNVTKSAALRRKALNSNEVVIKAKSNVYKTTHYILVIACEGLILSCFLTLLFRFRLQPTFFLLIVIDSVCILLSAIIQIIGFFGEKYVYLTNKGLIYFLGIFDFLENRFVWEESTNPEMLSNTLHIYKPKEQLPFTVTFENQVEVAHRIIEKHK